MNFDPFQEEPELMAPGPVEAIRRLFGQSVQLVIGSANESCIPVPLRGGSRNKFLGGPTEHVVAAGKVLWPLYSPSGSVYQRVCGRKCQRMPRPANDYHTTTFRINLAII